MVEEAGQKMGSSNAILRSARLCCRCMLMKEKKSVGTVIYHPIPKQTPMLHVNLTFFFKRHTITFKVHRLTDKEK